MDETHALYEEIRSLAFSDPLAAKRRIVALLDGDPLMLQSLLELATDPEDGRVRQIVARAAQRHPFRERIADTMAIWRERETDEFALAALNEVLVDARTKQGRRKVRSPEADLAATYRYLTRRLRHRVLNVVPRAGLSIDRILRHIRLASGENQMHSLLPLLDDLKTSLRRLEHAVDFDEDDAIFQPQLVHLGEWLMTHSPSFQAQHGPCEVQVDCTGCKAPPEIWATRYHLDLVFTNLWANSRQAVGTPCRISHTVSGTGRQIQVVVYDNGSGLEAADEERAFTLQFSTNGPERGRGHMEVAEAMERLGGSAAVRPIPSKGYRVVLTFPRPNR